MKDINTKQRILYIEDNADQLSLVQSYLESHLDVIVDAASSAGGAELMLNSNCYDLIISDLNLPIVFGTEILEKVLERDPGQPVMLLSEYWEGKAKEEAARIGVEIQPKFSNFEVKDFESFIEQVTQLLAKRPCSTNDAAYGRSERKRILTPIKLISENVSRCRAAMANSGQLRMT